MTPDLSVRIGSLDLATPVLVSSGTFGYASEFSELVDLGGLGAIVVKSITLAPREGNKPPRIAETPAGMLNSIGLQNVGVDAFIAEKLPFLRTLPVPVIANVAGTTMEEYEAVCGKLAGREGIAGVELNISCPNVRHGGMEFGTNPAAAEEITRRCRPLVPGPLIVKLSPNVTDIAAIARAAESGGADAVSLVNTFLGAAINVETRTPRLSTVFGGLSGPAIRPLAVRCVWQVAGAVKIPIIGMGGIVTGEDAAEFILAGATAVSVGTASFLDPAAALAVTAGLRQYLVRQNCPSLRDLIGAARA
ncbi:MAG: dihydroorotate dehydrogenase [Candidatus Coatesbacteria bacterium]